jgi:hypothetical protein
VCSLNIISFSHNILFCSHNILYCSLNILFCSHNISYCSLNILFVPAKYYLVPSIYYFGVHRRLSIRPSVTFHSKTFSSETTEPIRTKLGHRSPWIVLFTNCVQQVHITSMMSSSGEHSLKLDPMGITFKDLLPRNYLVNWK